MKNRATTQNIISFLMEIKLFLFFPPKPLSPVEEIRQDRNNPRWGEKNTVKRIETCIPGGSEREGSGGRQQKAEGKAKHLGTAAVW